MEYSPTLFFISVCIGLIPAVIAKRKARSFLIWWLYGTFAFLIAIIHVLLIKPKYVSHPAGLREKESYPRYSLDYIKSCDTEEMKAKGIEVRHDVSLNKHRLTVCLEESGYWFLSVFFNDDGSFDKFSLDYEAADDSHYEFIDEDTVRERIYREGDEELYLHDVLRRYISENSGYSLLSQIPVTMEFHF